MIADAAGLECLRGVGRYLAGDSMLWLGEFEAALPLLEEARRHPGPGAGRQRRPGGARRLEQPPRPVISAGSIGILAARSARWRWGGAPSSWPGSADTC